MSEFKVGDKVRVGNGMKHHNRIFEIVSFQENGYCTLLIDSQPNSGWHELYDKLVLVDDTPKLLALPEDSKGKGSVLNIPNHLIKFQEHRRGIVKQIEELQKQLKVLDDVYKIMMEGE